MGKEVKPMESARQTSDKLNNIINYLEQEFHQPAITEVQLNVGIKDQTLKATKKQIEQLVTSIEKNSPQLLDIGALKKQAQEVEKILSGIQLESKLSTQQQAKDYITAFTKLAALSKIIGTPVSDAYAHNYKIAEGKFSGEKLTQVEESAGRSMGRMLGESTVSLLTKTNPGLLNESEQKALIAYFEQLKDKIVDTEVRARELAKSLSVLSDLEKGDTTVPNTYFQTHDPEMALLKTLTGLPGGKKAITKMRNAAAEPYMKAHGILSADELNEQQDEALRKLGEKIGKSSAKQQQKEQRTEQAKKEKEQDAAVQAQADARERKKEDKKQPTKPVDTGASDNIQGEGNDIDRLEKKLEEDIPNAIEKKNEAFTKEKEHVQSVMEAEGQAIQENLVDKINDAINKIETLNGQEIHPRIGEPEQQDGKQDSSGGSGSGGKKKPKKNEQQEKEYDEEAARNRAKALNDFIEEEQEKLGEAIVTVRRAYDSHDNLAQAMIITRTGSAENQDLETKHYNLHYDKQTGEVSYGSRMTTEEVEKSEKAYHKLITEHYKQERDLLKEIFDLRKKIAGREANDVQNPLDEKEIGRLQVTLKRLQDERTKLRPTDDQGQSFITDFEREEINKQVQYRRGLKHAVAREKERYKTTQQERQDQRDQKQAEQLREQSITSHYKEELSAWKQIYDLKTAIAKRDMNDEQSVSDLEEMAQLYDKLEELKKKRVELGVKENGVLLQTEYELQKIAEQEDYIASRKHDVARARESYANDQQRNDRKQAEREAENETKRAQQEATKIEQELQKREQERRRENDAPAQNYIKALERSNSFNERITDASNGDRYLNAAEQIQKYQDILQNATNTVFYHPNGTPWNDKERHNLDLYIQQLHELEQEIERIRRNSNTVDQVREILQGEKERLNKVQNSNNGNYTKEFKGRMQAELNSLNQVIQSFEGRNGLEIVSTEQMNRVNQVRQNITALQDSSKVDENRVAPQTSVNNLMLKTQNWMARNSSITKDARKQLQEYIQELKNGVSPDRMRALASAITDVEQAEVAAGRAGQSFFETIGSEVTSMAAGWLAAFVSLQDIVEYLKTAFDAVRELDTALVDLKKTTTMTNGELNEFYFEANDIAKQMGVTTAEIISQAASWSRLNKIGLLHGNM